MRRLLAFAAALTFGVAAVPAWAAEPILGTWRLERQEINGQSSNFEPLTLKVSQAGDKLVFAFSVPVNDVYFVAMTYTLKLDGLEADVKNAQGEKVGTVQMTPGGPSQYKILMKAPHRPDSSGKLTVSPDGKTLISEADSLRAGESTRSKQFFTRY
jgi:hypothetical protein